jgi:hypothetical protein
MQTDASTQRTGVIRGALLAESLRPGTVLDGHGISVVRLSRYEVRDTVPWQPPLWTLIEFEAPEASAAALADDLAACLLERGWYANWTSDSEATVVFPGKVFRYRRGDLAGREEAQEHGRRCGVPEPQLDWTD